MTSILFLCHGNICRSPMAEYIMKHLVADAHLQSSFRISSAAVSTEEIGNDIYPPAKRTLTAHGIPFSHHSAHQITPAEFLSYDYIICMDRSNLSRLSYLIPSSVDDEKVSLMMHWAHIHRDVADPWYTGNFEATFSDLLLSCTSLLSSLNS